MPETTPDAKSFYNLDYIIEINEKRHEQYTSAYQKVLERFTNIILIYSAITIFLIPLIQGLIKRMIPVSTNHWVFCISFGVFAFFFLISVYNTIRLIIPEEVSYLEIPKKYYTDYLTIYETTIPDKTEVTKLLKASYITELETAVRKNEAVFRKKSSFYYNALMFALISVVPYLVCLGFHITSKEETVQKIEIVNPKK